MKRYNYYKTLTIKLMRGLFVCLLLQNCISNTSSIDLNRSKVQSSSTAYLDTNAILGKAFVAEDNHLVDFYQEGNELKANVQINPLDEVDKFYNGIDVWVEAGVDLAELARLDKATQKRRIQVQFNPTGTPKNIVVHKPWLMGGSPNEIVMFCGNPGVGKSTLCNSIFGKAVFESGLSNFTGLTTVQQQHLYESKLYIDTPGLEDAKKREQAAREIEKALKQDNYYKLVFVAKTDSGRIRLSDLNTINLICATIKTPFEYGIVINQVSKAELAFLEKIGVTEKHMIDFLSETDPVTKKQILQKKPASIILLGKDKALEDENNKYLQGNDENRKKLLEFINKLRANKIDPKNVDKVDTRSLEDIKKDLEDYYDKKFADAKEEATKKGCCVIS